VVATSFVVICHHICVLVSFYLITSVWEAQFMITLKKGRLKRGTQILPLTRGKIAAQEQKRIIGHYIDNMWAGYKEVRIPYDHR
jgi:hypothetical protein